MSPRVFIGMETSGAMRRRLQARGVIAVSVDILEAEDAPAWNTGGGHIQGDVFETFSLLNSQGWAFDAGIFHPPCTYLTKSAAWAFNDPDFVRYPAVGYHQRIAPCTLTGAARREARDIALADVRRILALPIPCKVLENPIGAITRVRHATQIIHPYQFGDDASKGTVLIMDGLPKLPINPASRKGGRLVEWPRNSGRMIERWANQTDSGQSNVAPSPGRWKHRSRTYPGFADALTDLICAALAKHCSDASPLSTASAARNAS